MGDFEQLFSADCKRYGGMIADRWTRAFHYYFRKQSTTKNKLLKWYYRERYKRICNARGIELKGTVSIGKGFCVYHPYTITINPDAVLGENVNVHKGVTIGQENRGKRKGAPQIGNKVWIGINATIVGKITIGDDVLIAPNTFVNCDIPAHSVVVGNPCRIIHNENATKGYVDNEA